MAPVLHTAYRKTNRDWKCIKRRHPQEVSFVIYGVFTL